MKIKTHRMKALPSTDCEYAHVQKDRGLWPAPTRDFAPALPSHRWSLSPSQSPQTAIGRFAQARHQALAQQWPPFFTGISTDARGAMDDADQKTLSTKEPKAQRTLSRQNKSEPRILAHEEGDYQRETPGYLRQGCHYNICKNLVLANEDQVKTVKPFTTHSRELQTRQAIYANLLIFFGV